MPREIKSEDLHARVSHSTKQLATQKAEQRGLTQSQYIEWLVHQDSQAVVEPQWQELAQQEREKAQALPYVNSRTNDTSVAFMKDRIVTVHLKMFRSGLRIPCMYIRNIDKTIAEMRIRQAPTQWISELNEWKANLSSSPEMYWDFLATESAHRKGIKDDDELRDFKRKQGIILSRVKSKK
jgi:antitoxin component of RelBE/YafQ-DinJ toxin-antitoxin module